MCALLDISQYLKVRPRPGVPWFHSFDSKASRFFFRRYSVKAILALGKNSLNNSIHIYIYIKGEVFRVHIFSDVPPFPLRLLPVLALIPL